MKRSVAAHPVLPVASASAEQAPVDALLIDRLPFGVCVIAGCERYGFLLLSGNATLQQMLALADPCIPAPDDPGFTPLVLDPGFRKAVERLDDGDSDDDTGAVRFTWRTNRRGASRLFACSLQQLDPDPVDPAYLLTIADRTRDTQHEQQLLHDAFHDRLTQLPNAALFMLRVSEWLDHRRTRKTGTILTINLNRFQTINESLGHKTGDGLIVAAAQRIAACLPQGTLVARMGGDEFAVLLTRLDSGDESHAIAQTLHAHVSAPLTLDGHDLRVTASIGIVHVSARATAEELLRNANIAMHRAKREGHGRTVVYHNDLKAHAKSRFEFEGDLRRALEQNDLTLHYQPIYSLASGELTGFEALCRWQHPERGMVPPVDFIPVAEASGLIIPLGRWALHAACAQLADWSARYPAVANLTMNVNVSGLQISGDSMAAVVREVLLATGLNGNQLRLEITESALMTNAELAADLLLDLKSYGVCLALDDFGTGYSSLSYLNRFPIDTIKIDRSFITNLDSNPDDAKIVHIITQLASTLGLSAVAEGIETAAHLDRLKLLGCHYGQGYYFSRPLPAAAVESQLFI